MASQLVPGGPTQLQAGMLPQKATSTEAGWAREWVPPDLLTIMEAEDLGSPMEETDGPVYPCSFSGSNHFTARATSW